MVNSFISVYLVNPFHHSVKLGATDFLISLLNWLVQRWTQRKSLNMLTPSIFLMGILTSWAVKRKGCLLIHSSNVYKELNFWLCLILCSLDLRRGPNYNTIGETSTSPKCKAPVVFCIHGNKYGVVKCCDNLNDEAGASNQDNAKLTGTLNEVSDEDATSSQRNRRAPSGDT